MAAVDAALVVLDRFMAALNAGDEPALLATLHFPHYRLAGGRMRVSDQPGSYLGDFRARAGADWHHSGWDFRDVIAAGPAKVHLDVQFTRYRADNSVIGSFRSLWIVTGSGGRWAVAARSSFADQPHNDDYAAARGRAGNLERAMGFEPTTPTLARLK
jgi:hypothetical protein